MTHILKGALVATSSTLPLPQVIPFQYNPTTLTRGLTPRYVGDYDGNRAGEMRFNRAPDQSISVSIFLDATDALNQGSPVAAKLGVYPQLAQLELLLYPTMPDVVEEAALATAGTIELLPTVGLTPRVLFVWGQQRVLPVRLEEYTIQEELFDSDLNTLRATIGLKMKVLTYSDLDPSAPSYPLFVAYQTALLTSAAAVSAIANTVDVIGIKIPSF